MASYLELTNELLRELNEVPLTSADFTNAKGVQQMVKDKVNLAYLDIVNEEPRWPFLVVQDSGFVNPYYGNVEQETVAEQRWYKLEPGASDHSEDYINVDWNSFYLTNRGVTGATAPYASESLKYVPANRWRDVVRDMENMDSAGDIVTSQPHLVIRSHDNRSFGLSPIPDKVYKVRYFAYRQPTELVTATDELVFPDTYKSVILAKARYYVWQFKQNYDAAQIALAEYRRGLRSMRQNLLGNGQDDIHTDKIRIV